MIQTEYTKYNYCNEEIKTYSNNLVSKALCYFLPNKSARVYILPLLSYWQQNTFVGTASHLATENTTGFDQYFSNRQILTKKCL